MTTVSYFGRNIYYNHRCRNLFTATTCNLIKYKMYCVTLSICCETIIIIWSFIGNQTSLYKLVYMVVWIADSRAVTLSSSNLEKQLNVAHPKRQTTHQITCQLTHQITRQTTRQIKHQSHIEPHI